MPGPIDGDRRARQRACIQSRSAIASSSSAAPFGLVEADDVVLARRDVASTASATAASSRSVGTIRIAGASITAAPSSARRLGEVACLRARARHHDGLARGAARARARRAVPAAPPPAPITVTAGGPIPSAAGDLGDCAERARDGALAGKRASLDDGGRLVRAPAVLDQRSARAQGCERPCRRRASRESGERGPVERAFVLRPGPRGR